MTKDEINSEIEEAKKGNGGDRFKIIDEKLYRYEWESGLMIWSYSKKELKWNKTKEGTWFCKCGNYSQNYKDFTEKLYYPEYEKLFRLRDLHLKRIKEKYEQMSFIGKESRKQKEERQLETLFDEFHEWVDMSVEIENKPYTRVIAVFQGVRA